MHTTTISAAVVALALGCGGSYPVPTQNLAQAQSAERSASELGAETQPKAQLHLALAREQIAKAGAEMRAGENERADLLLVRARSDAELAIALTRNQNAKVGSQKATEQSNAQTKTNANQQGAAQ